MSYLSDTACGPTNDVARMLAQGCRIYWKCVSCEGCGNAINVPSTHIPSWGISECMTLKQTLVLYVVINYLGFICGNKFNFKFSAACMRRLCNYF